MSSPSKAPTKSQQDRQSSQELLKVYGTLLTPKQYAMTAGYCHEGKSFSQIAREQGISRQAVHEAVRGVQRLLRYYEDKLQLGAMTKADSGQAAETPAASPSRKTMTEAAGRLEALRNQVTRKGIIYTPDWIVQEINATIELLEKAGPSGSGGKGEKTGKASAKQAAKKR